MRQRSASSPTGRWGDGWMRRRRSRSLDGTSARRERSPFWRPDQRRTFGMVGGWTSAARRDEIRPHPSAVSALSFPLIRQDTEKTHPAVTLATSPTSAYSGNRRLVFSCRWRREIRLKSTRSSPTFSSKREDARRLRSPTRPTPSTLSRRVRCPDGLSAAIRRIDFLPLTP
jgi:hypothetical protein